MAYSFQTFSVGEVLTASKMNQVEVNVRDHVHGNSSVSNNISDNTEGTTFDYDNDYVGVYDDSAAARRKVRLSALNSHRKNAIIGGDFSTNPWQRGTSYTSVANLAYTADRWIYGKSGAMVHDISKSANAPTVAEAGRFTQHCILVDCTTVDSSIAAGDYAILIQKVEGYNFLPLAQRAFTLSFWHAHTKTGTYCVAFYNSTQDRSYVAEYTQAVADTWERSTITVSASPSAGTWDYTNGVGLHVAFVMAAGSTYQTTANTWQTGAFFSTSNQVNATDNVANNFRLALVQLEPGSVATEFEQRTFQDELALCQRYYEKSFELATAPAQNVGSNSGCIEFPQAAAASTLMQIPNIEFTVRKRAAPTVTLYNPNAANAQARNLTIGADFSGTSGVTAGERAHAIEATTPAGSAIGQRCTLHWTANAEL